MKLYALPLALVLSVSLSNAIKVPMKRVRSTPPPLRKRSGRTSYSRPVLAVASSQAGDAVDLTTVHDLIYFANITLGGIDYPVQLDTGSSDLWIKGPSYPLPNANLTSTTYNLTYGIGWANGTVAYAPVEFAGIKVPSQAYLDISSAQNPALSYGADGIAGLGFTSLSTVDALINRTGSSSGRSLLFNAFNDNPSEPNFIAFALQRSSDNTDDVIGSFSIGEVEPEYTDVLNTTAISTFPVNSPDRWNVLLDAVLVGSQTVALSSTVDGVPSNKAVVLLDSGTSYTYASADVCNAIYGSVSGAKYDSSLSQWLVPCDAEIDIALQFGGQVFPIHPLDVSPKSLTDSSTCVGSFVPQSVAVGPGEFDWLVGDNVLRSMYTVYDFGDFDSSGNMGNPYIKLLSLVDPSEASVDFHQVRGGSPANVTYNAANSTSTSSGSTSVKISDDLVSDIEKITTYVPAMLAIMALNALVILLLVITGIVYMCRRRTKGVKARKNMGRMTPMPMNRMSTFDMPVLGGEPHTYQPVSMAFTEDTFVPPSPAFSKSGMGDRPKSVA